jgi:pimeloyl-ACP methyl ester carboxylesterase
MGRRHVEAFLAMVPASDVRCGRLACGNGEPNGSPVGLRPVVGDGQVPALVFRTEIESGAVYGVRARGPKPDPILFLTGGPGGSGLAEGPGVAKDWRPDRDVIFLDQRGALKSEPFLSCPEIDNFMAHTVGLSWSSPSTAKQDAAATRTCRHRLAAVGADLAAYNTTESASDVADLRIAMGIDRWNIYGISYGSDLALQVLRDHPAGIRSLVIDAVLPPT